MALSTLITCRNGFEAEMIKSKLDAYDLPCVLQGESVSNIYGYGINFGHRAFSIQVLVREEDLAAALDVIKEEEISV